MGNTFDYSEEKNLVLKETRKVDFKEIIEAIKKGKTLDDLEHANKKKYSNQRILIVEVNGYAYVVPYVADKKNITNKKRKKKFLKTLYPSREATKKYFNRRNK